MLKSKIKTHKSGKTYNQPHFFILNKEIFNVLKELSTVKFTYFIVTIQVTNTNVITYLKLTKWYSEHLFFVFDFEAVK